MHVVITPSRKPRFITGIAILLLPTGVLAQDTIGRDEQLLERIWTGVQEAQNKYTTGCGKITETRTSDLLSRPLVLRGRFCAEGTAKFYLEYFEPHPVRLKFNEDYLNVSTGPAAEKTAVFKIGHHVRRTQSYFSDKKSLRNLLSSFDVSVEDSGRNYRMKLVPRTRRFERRLNSMVVELDKKLFLLRSLTVNGTSGVSSVFTIDIAELNIELGAETFQVYRPR